uniref:Uncharacterized protein n=1 Tax=Lactuca sativa TaxID=4236 RepID=A0A9R1UMQ3_LACSA|nr:hypothetical protein LSAT_V11C800436370 [Lactuca sativa]
MKVKRRSGMSMKDVENEAPKLYDTSGSKFNDTIVFNEIMMQHDHVLNVKWMMKKVVVAQKRSRSTEEGDYCVQSNTEGESISGSTIKRPTGRDATKGKEKGRFRMRKPLFLRIMEAVTANDRYFQQDVMSHAKKVFHHYKNVLELCGCWHMGHQQIHMMNI